MAHCRGMRLGERAGAVRPELDGRRGLCGPGGFPRRLQRHSAEIHTGRNSRRRLTI